MAVQIQGTLAHSHPYKFGSQISTCNQTCSFNSFGVSIRAANNCSRNLLGVRTPSLKAIFDVALIVIVTSRCSRLLQVAIHLKNNRTVVNGKLKDQ
jgi:hypothetical protein